MLPFPVPQSHSLGCRTHLSQGVRKRFILGITSLSRRKLKWQLKPHGRAHLHLLLRVLRGYTSAMSTTNYCISESKIKTKVLRMADLPRTTTNQGGPKTVLEANHKTTPRALRREFLATKNTQRCNFGAQNNMKWMHGLQPKEFMWQIFQMPQNIIHSETDD